MLMVAALEMAEAEHDYDTMDVEDCPCSVGRPGIGRDR
jgi:hypothetical protein